MVAGGGTMASAPPPAVGGNGGCTGLSANISNLPGTTATGAATLAATLAASPQGTNEGGPTRTTRSNENRRSNKPIMEKRRRARINNCLNELKTLILDAMKKDPARHSKLEKADILEMTVKHLEALQRQQVAMAAATDPNVANKFRAGFTECAGEVGRFPGLEGPIKRRLLQHLANCLNSASPPNGSSPPPVPSLASMEAAQPTPASPISSPTSNPPLQVHILRTPTQGDVQSAPSNIILANTNGQGVQLVPTRLPNGDIALILPSSNSFRTARPTSSVTPSSSPSPSASSTSSGSSPLPMLIPVPQRTSANSPPVAIDRLSMNPSTPPRQITIVTAPNSQRLLIPQQQPASGGGKAVPLVTYQCGEEHVVRQGVILPEPVYPKSEKVIPVMREVDPNVMQAPRKDSMEAYEDRICSDDDGLYDRNGLIMSHDGRIVERERSNGVYAATEKGNLRPDRETLIHIPERDSYYESMSPRSPIGYVDTVEDHKYGEYYSEHYDERPYSPDMPRPLALVTRKKCEEYAANEERPWRPW